MSLQTRLAALITAIGADMKAKANLEYDTTTKTADYTLAAADKGTYIRMNKSSDAVLTVPVLTAKYNVKIFNASAFYVTITASSTTFNNAVGLRIPPKRAVELIYVTTSNVDVIGTLVA